MKARHLPTVVDAVAWNDDDDSRRELADLGYRGDCGDFAYEDPDAAPGTRTLLVPTGERVSTALAGEYYVLRGPDGGWYPVHRAVFTARYEAPVSS